MKKLTLLLVFVLIFTSVCPIAFASEETSSQLTGQEIKALQIPAMILYDTAGYATAYLSGYVTSIAKGTWVEYMNPDSSKSMRRARIKLGSGVVCWVPMSALYISRYNYTIADTLTDADREAFVNEAGYTSKTPYLVWVNKERQRLTVFLGSQGNWKALKTFPVATGKNTTPTPTTVCEYTYKTVWREKNYVCNPVLYLYDGYAIHNQPTSYAGYVLDHTMGRPASAGCIRMLQSDVNWVFYYVTVGTTVVLH